MNAHNNRIPSPKIIIKIIFTVFLAFLPSLHFSSILATPIIMAIPTPVSSAKNVPSVK